MLDTDYGWLYQAARGERSIQDNETFGTISCSRDGTQGLL